MKGLAKNMRNMLMSQQELRMAMKKLQELNSRENKLLIEEGEEVDQEEATITRRAETRSGSTDPTLLIMKRPKVPRMMDGTSLRPKSTKSPIEEVEEEELLEKSTNSHSNR